MIDRATIIDENFSRRVAANDLPHCDSLELSPDYLLNDISLVKIFDSQLRSRHLDIQARILKDKQLGFYTISSSGHEVNAALAAAFKPSDPAFLHYRSGAFVLQRALSFPEVDMTYDILLSLVTAKADPIANGRHKVFGSLALNIPPQTSTIASHLPKAVGAALSIVRAKELKIQNKFNHDSVVLCSFGDASFNHSVAQAAINTAQWIAHQSYPLPLVFICEDNGLGISVPTPCDWIESTMAGRSDIHYIAANGLNVEDTYRAAKQAEAIARHKKQPVVLHMKTVRLMGHAGSDIESSYLSQEQIEAQEAKDPLLYMAQLMLDREIYTTDEVLQRYESIRAEVADKAQSCEVEPNLSSASEVMASIIPPLNKHPLPALPTKQQRQQIFQDKQKQLNMPRNMAQQLNLALHDILLQYNNVVVLGEDVGKKGGVYHITTGLQQQFGGRRVFDTLLDETSILGTAIGFAHNGFLPIPEIQFLAYYHNAEDQIRGEAATLSFFSSGQYTNPMVLRLPSFAYQKGFGGHFHNDNSIAAIRDLPGVIIATPSHGDDAAKMLRTLVAKAYQEQRICIFLEPIALYMVKDLYEAGDNAFLAHYSAPEEQITFGELGVYGSDSETVIISYANGCYLARKAAHQLMQQHQYPVKVIDLRWLAPINYSALVEEISHAKHIIIVDECRKTGSVSEEIVTNLVEQMTNLPKISRITAADSFIPLGKAWQYILPSVDQIIQAVLHKEIP